jgi:hypothetical protein
MKKAWLLSLIDVNSNNKRQQVIGLFMDSRKLNSTIEYAKQVNPKIILDVQMVEIIDS